MDFYIMKKNKYALLNEVVVLQLIFCVT